VQTCAPPISRAGCEAAVEQSVRAGIRLTNAAEARTIAQVVEERCASLPPEDLAVVGYHAWSQALQRGIAAHHAGLLPVFKETVEVLFAAGLVKVVYATETLALGWRSSCARRPPAAVRAAA